MRGARLPAETRERACLAGLRRALGPSLFERLLVFLAFVRMAHYWTKVHTELEVEQDIKDLLATHEALAECVDKCRSTRPQSASN